MSDTYYLTGDVIGLCSGILYARQGTRVRLLEELVPWRNPVLVEEILTEEEVKIRPHLRFTVRHELLGQTPVAPAAPPVSPKLSTPRFRDDLPKPKDNHAQTSLF